MGTKIYKPGDVIFQTGNKITSIGIVVKGNVNIIGEYNTVTVSSGSMIGLSDVYADEYIFDYVASDEVTLFAYNYTNSEDLVTMLKIKPELSSIFVNTMFRTMSMHVSEYERMRSHCNYLYKYIKDAYQEYKNLCIAFGVPVKAIPEIDDLEPYEMKETLDSWLIDYYKKLYAVPTDMKKAFYGMSKSICYGTVMEVAKHIVSVHEMNVAMTEYITRLEDIVMNESESDLFSLYTGISFKVYKAKMDTATVDAKLESIITLMKDSYISDKEMVEKRVTAYKTKLENTDFSGDDTANDGDVEDGKLRADLVDSLETIMDYAKMSDESKAVFRDLINSYKAMPDKNSVDTECRAIRKQITAQFFEIYESVALRYFEDFGTPIVIKMFLYFGYVDEELAGIGNAEKLYKMAETRYPDGEGHVFMLIDWLKQIYEGNKEPSKNQFDVDYATFIRDEKRSGRITEKEGERLLQDGVKKVNYEMANVVRSANQITFGRISNYCPVFSEHNLIKSLDAMYIYNSTISEAIEHVKRIDYSAFYRESSFSDERNGINKVFLQTEVIPDVILMPNVGSRGLMWQEYYGNYRNTPARMFVSVFCSELIEDIVIRMTGEFRWELCKRIQGPRWNDITDKSLTSEYSDYAQFYRKNNDLSPEAKEKIKLNLSRCKNNFRELFVREYMVWVKFESAGSARLNKVSRQIMYNYCPFHPDLRPSLQKNPMFTDIMERYENRKIKKLSQVDLLFRKIEKEGGKITPELQAHRDFIAL